MLELDILGQSLVIISENDIDELEDQSGYFLLDNTGEILEAE